MSFGRSWESGVMPGVHWLSLAPDPVLVLKVTHLHTHMISERDSTHSRVTFFGGLSSPLSQMRKPRPRDSREPDPGSPVGSGCLQRLSSHSGVSRQGLQAKRMGVEVEVGMGVR